VVNQRQSRGGSLHPPGVAGSIFVSNGDYGAWSDGGMRSLDAFPSLQAAVDAGPGTVWLPPGTHPFSGQILVPEYVNLWGAGDGHLGAATTLLATSADAQIAFGEAGVASYAGVSGNFRIDADGLATHPMFCGQTQRRQFQNISLYDGAAGGALLTLNETQNCLFLGMNFLNGGGDHIVIDQGAAGNHFFGFESSHAGNVHLRFQATAPATPGLTSLPINNHFWAGIFERLTGSGAGLVHYGAGVDNGLHSVHLAIKDFAVPMVRVEVTDATHTGGFNSVLLLDGVYSTETTSGAQLATHYDVDDTSRIEVDGSLALNAGLYGFRLRDSTSRFNFSGGRLLDSGVGTLLDPASVGTIFNMIQTLANTRTIHTTGSAGDAVHSYVVAGEAGERFRVSPQGISANDGTDFSPDSTFLRSGSTGVGGWVSNKPLIGLTVHGSAVATKTANYTTTASDQTIKVDTTSGAVTITLVSAVFLPGMEHIIMRTAGANNVVVDGNGAQHFTGAGFSAAATLTLGSTGAFVIVKSDGANWLVIGQGGTVT
jgi:hypothetical protein